MDSINIGKVRSVAENLMLSPTVTSPYIIFTAATEGFEKYFITSPIFFPP